MFLEEHGYRRITVTKAKAALGMPSIKDPQTRKWYWVYPAREVQEWLLSELSNGPITLAVLFDMGLTVKGWQPMVLRMARLACGGITPCLIDGQVGWRVR